jgi:hypothetical protein
MPCAPTLPCEARHASVKNARARARMEACRGMGDRVLCGVDWVLRKLVSRLRHRWFVKASRGARKIAIELWEEPPPICFIPL